MFEYEFEIKKERYDLFNDAINTFHLRLHGIGPQMREVNPLPPLQG